MISNKSEISKYLRNFTLNAKNPSRKNKPKRDLDFFIESDGKTIIENFYQDNFTFPKYINEYWTSKQRQASSIHEVSYRACFKPQLPRFFIQILTNKNDIVYDPFSGRGTTFVEAGILNRKVILNDINPLSIIFARPRFKIPKISEIEERIDAISFNNSFTANIDISMFYHKDTESEIVSLKKYLKSRKDYGKEDYIDEWIRMVATNRLTGHSKGFFSVYTLPPNQAVLPARQIKINENRNQTPEYKDIKSRILKKSKSLLRNLKFDEKTNLNSIGNSAIFLNRDARNTSEILDESVQLTVTSPPFLNIVQYSTDNWLRCWFNSLDTDNIAKGITMSKTIKDWNKVMSDVFKELFRITNKGGWVAFEVGEVRKGKVKLDEYVVPLGINSGFSCEGILINSQKFTKTSNIWGVKNNTGGTNSNRIVLFNKN